MQAGPMPLCRVCPSVRLSVYHVRGFFNFFTVGKPRHSSFFRTKRHGSIRTGTRLTGRRIVVVAVAQTELFLSMLYNFINCRAMLCKRGLCRYAVSVRQSVRLSICRSVRHVRGFFNFFTLGKPRHSSFFRTKRHGSIRTGTRLTGASNSSSSSSSK